MSNYNINITDGKGSEKVAAGSFLAVIDAPGFDNSSLLPIMVNLPNTSTTTNLTLSATGSLTIVFNETGDESGRGILNGTVIMTDETGETQYGRVVNINSNGEAVFEKVPFGDSENLYDLHFVQLSSDDSHRKHDGVFTVSMESSTKRHHVKNDLTIEQHFVVTSIDHENLPIKNAVLTLK